MQSFKTLFLILVAAILPLFISTASTAQSTDSKEAVQSRLFILPVVFSTPEISWGFGASAIYTFSLRDIAYSNRPSQLQFAAIYTLKNQLLLYLPYAFYLHDNKYRVQGESGYYRYSYSYFGIGNNTPESNEEVYDANYPRFIASISQQVIPDFYVGLRYWFDDYDIVDIEPGGLLENLQPAGLEGRINSGMALTLLYDSRDNIFYTKKGSFAEFIFHTDQGWLGSDFQFYTYSLDLRTFYTNQWETIPSVLISSAPSAEVPLLFTGSLYWADPTACVDIWKAGSVIITISHFSRDTDSPFTSALERRPFWESGRLHRLWIPFIPKESK